MTSLIIAAFAALSAVAALALVFLIRAAAMHPHEDWLEDNEQ